jgi:hypothetical protein
MFSLYSFIYSENEKIGFAVGTEGGTIYEGTVFCGEINFKNFYQLKTTQYIGFENFCGMQFTNKCTDLTLNSLCSFYKTEKISLGSGVLTHFSFLYDINFEYDILLNFKSIFGKKSSLYNLIFEFDLFYKGSVIYSLPSAHNYLFNTGFGLNVCNKFNLPEQWNILLGFRTWELYKYSATLNFTFYFEFNKTFLEHYEINAGLYFRYLDQNNTTAYFEYPALRAGFVYAF